MMLPRDHPTGEYIHKTCDLKPDYIHIRYGGLMVAICCERAHTIIGYDTDDLEHAKVLADELARVHKVRIVER